MLYMIFAYCVGGPDQANSWCTFLLFEGLTICAAVGQRTIENHQRQSFRQLLQERELRATTESRLAQMEDRWIVGELPYQSETCSRPETTLSNRVFQEPDESDGGSPCLKTLEGLGRKEHWYIDLGELKLKPEFLGQGSYGVVLAGEFHGSPVAVKANMVSNTSSRHSVLCSLMNEVRVLRRLRHPNIVLLHGACVDITRGDVSIVLERVYGRTLEDLISAEDSAKSLMMPDRLGIIVDISRALRYLHSRSPPVVHGDLKDSNIIAEEQPRKPVLPNQAPGLRPVAGAHSACKARGRHATLGGSGGAA